MILLDPGVLVVDVQRRNDAVGQDARAKPARRPLGDAALEDQLHLIGPAEVEVLADDFLEEDAARCGRSSTWVSENSACRIDTS